MLGNIIIKDSSADLNSETYLAEGVLYCTLGRVTKGDGQGADYYWDPTSSAAVSEPNVYKPALITGNNNGRFILRG